MVDDAHGDGVDSRLLWPPWRMRVSAAGAAKGLFSIAVGTEARLRAPRGSRGTRPLERAPSVAFATTQELCPMLRLAVRPEAQKGEARIARVRRLKAPAGCNYPQRPSEVWMG